MAKYVSAKEFRLRFPEVVKDLEKWGEIVVLKRSKPLFKVVPFESSPTDLLDRAGAIQDNARPELEEISRFVHKIRNVS